MNSAFEFHFRTPFSFHTIFSYYIISQIQFSDQMAYGTTKWSPL